MMLREIEPATTRAGSVAVGSMEARGGKHPYATRAYTVVEPSRATANQDTPCCVTVVRQRGTDVIYFTAYFQVCRSTSRSTTEGSKQVSDTVKGKNDTTLSLYRSTSGSSGPVASTVKALATAALRKTWVKATATAPTYSPAGLSYAVSHHMACCR